MLVIVILLVLLIDVCLAPSGTSGACYASSRFVDPNAANFV
jgi:hypothetical protein